jgi:UMF1 family MFS transporter
VPVRPWSPRARIVAWTLYDFGNSAFSAIVQVTVWPAYYTNLVVGNATGRGDFWWGLAVSLAMVLVAASAPVLGGIADHAGSRKPFLAGLTAASVLVTALLAAVAPGMLATGFLLGVAGLVATEAAFVFYNSYLTRIVGPDRLGRLSAAGFAVGYGGSLVAFLAAWPLAAREAYWACFLTAAAQFAIFSLPACVVLPGDPAGVPLAAAAARGVHRTVATVREIWREPAREAMRRFLLAYLVYEDGVNTVITFSGVFAATTLGFSFTEIIALFMVVQVAALLGSAGWARATDRRGPRFVVRVTLVQWTLVTVAAFFVPTKSAFWVVALLAGTGLGAIQAASRAFMASLVERGREAEFFAFYALVGKAGAILGPLVFGGLSAGLGGNQRAAIVAVGAFFVAGLALLRRVHAGGPTAGTPGRADPLPS